MKENECLKIYPLGSQSKHSITQQINNKIIDIGIEKSIYVKKFNGWSGYFSSKNPFTTIFGAEPKKLTNPPIDAE